MSTRAWLGIIGLVLVALGVGAVAALWVQNMGRTTQLSADLGFTAWQLQDPVAIPVLIAISFGSGLLLGVVALLPGSMSNARKARKAQQRLALLEQDKEW